MTNYLHLIFGIASLLVGVYLFLLYFRIYVPKFKKIEQKEKFEESARKFGTLIKICSIIMIINGGYDLIVRDASRYQIGSSEKKEEWTSEIKEILIDECVLKAGNKANISPETSRIYCECVIEKIANSLTYSEYKEMNNNFDEEQKKLFMSLIEDCLNQHKARIDSLENQKSSR
jgi:ATP-dependent Lon protease